jgi:hypothetical protein
LRRTGIPLALKYKYASQLLQSVLNECSNIEVNVGFSNRKQLISIKKPRREKSWQTIAKRIRAVSRVVKRRRAVKVIKVVKKLDAVKVNNRADSNAAKVVKAATVAVNEIAKIISARRGEFGALLDQTHLDRGAHGMTTRFTTERRPS